MRKKAILCFLGALVLSTGAGTWGSGADAAGDPALVVTASLKAVPDVYNGFCPTTITFKGIIEVNEPCTLQYKFIRSDGALAPVKTLTCPKPGKYAVSTTWTLGKTYDGWQAVEVVSPVSIKSNQAAFSIKCVPKPNITDAWLKYMGSPKPEMDIKGTGFGAVQGTKNVKIDGTLVTSLPGWSVIFWNDTMITLQAKDIIPWDHVYQIAVTEGSTVISNVLSKKFLYTIDGISPNQGPMGSTVKVYIWDIPAAPGGLVLKLGTYNFTILSWGPGASVQARVPTAPAGTYEVYLQKGSDVVSKKVNFTVKPLVLPKPVIKK